MHTMRITKADTTN